MEFLDAYESRITLFRSSSRRSKGGERNERFPPIPSALAGPKQIWIPYRSATRCNCRAWAASMVGITSAPSVSRTLPVPGLPLPKLHTQAQDQRLCGLEAQSEA
jgi:hypothetical protein